MVAKKTYFASDLHLGSPNHKESLEREKLFVKWLDQIKNDAAEIFLVGDIFDFWWEWKYVVPRGFTRFLGKIAEITDKGITVHLFTGNHDVWVYDYLPAETGMTIHHDAFKTEIAGLKFYIAHGDGLGHDDAIYRFLKKYIYRSKFHQWWFARLHPNLSVWFAHKWSKTSRKSHGEDVFFGDEKEWLFLHSKDILKNEHFDYFVYGHRHLEIQKNIAEKSQVIYLGDWLKSFSYAVFDGNVLELKRFHE